MFIFRDDKEMGFFLKKLKNISEEFEVKIHAFCIMGNHYHILATTAEPNISEFMQKLQSTYANHLVRNGWVGHVFERRFEAKLVNESGHLRNLARYIHLNPVRAGIVTSPEKYPWSSYKQHISLEAANSQPWISTGLLLEQFGSNKVDAMSRLKAFILEGVREGREGFHRERVIAHAVFGSGQFVDDVREILAPGYNPGHLDKLGEKLVLKVRGLFMAYEMILSSFQLKSLHIDDNDFEQDRHQIMSARKAFIFLAKKYTIATNAEIARVLRDIGGTAVSQAFSRIIKALDEEPIEPAVGLNESVRREILILRELDERMKRRLGIPSHGVWPLVKVNG